MVALKFLLSEGACMVNLKKTDYYPSHFGASSQYYYSQNACNELSSSFQS